MTRSALFLGLFSLFLVAACAPPAADEPEEAIGRSAAQDTAEVEAAIGAHWTAIEQGDSAAIDSHHLPNLTVFLAAIDERFARGSAEEAALIESLETTTTAWTPRDFDVQLEGDVAVASFYLDGSITDAEGTVDSRTRRVTAVWVRQADGRWLELHHHDSITAPEL